MRTQAARTDAKFQMHCVIAARFHKRIREVALHEDVTISELVVSILEPEIDRRIERIRSAIANPK